MSEDAIQTRPIKGDPVLKEEFGPFGRELAERYFEAVRFPETGVEELRQLSERGFVVHVMRTTAWVNYLFLHWALIRRALPPIRAVVNLRRWFTKPFTNAQMAGEHGTRFEWARQQGGSGLIFLRESGFNTARGRESREDPFPALVELARSSERPIFLVPELLVWEKWQQKVMPSLWDRVFGSPEAPGFVHSVVTFVRNYDRAQLRLGTPIDLREVLANEGDQPDRGDRPQGAQLAQPPPRQADPRRVRPAGQGDRPAHRRGDARQGVPGRGAGSRDREEQAVARGDARREEELRSDRLEVQPHATWAPPPRCCTGSSTASTTASRSTRPGSIAR